VFGAVRIFVTQDLQYEHDKTKSSDLLGELRIRERLHPVDPVRLKRTLEGNQDKGDNFVLGLLIDSYCRALDQSYMQQVFQALRSYE
jgi:hypothetical protein